MRNLLYLLAIIIFSLNFLGGCSNNSETVKIIETAESLLETNPESALVSISSLNRQHITDDELNARYILASTIAQHKCFIDENNDSLISLAAKYFSRHSDNRRAMLAYYYIAVINNDIENYIKCSSAIMNAYKHAKLEGDTFWLGRIFNELFRVNQATFNMHEAVKWANNSVEMFRHTDNLNFYIESRICQAKGYMNIDNYNRCIEILDSITDYIPDCDSIMQGWWHSCYFAALFYNQASASSINKAARDCENFIDALEDRCYFYSLWSRHKILQNDTDSAAILLEKAFTYSIQPDSDILLLSAQLYYNKHIDNTANQASIIQKLLATQNKKVETAIRQSVAVAQRDFYEHESVIKNLESKFFRQIALVSIPVFTFIIIISIIIYRQHLKLKNSELRNKMMEIAYLQKDLSDNIEHIDKLQGNLSEQNAEIKTLTEKVGIHKNKEEQLNNLVNRLFASHFSALNRLSNEYFESRINTNTKIFYNNLQKEIEKICEPAFIQNIQTIVNECRDNAVEKLHTITILKDDDIKFLTLVLSGLSAKAICLIMNYQLKNYYAKRSRLKDKILKTDCEHRDFIVNLLS